MLQLMYLTPEEIIGAGIAGIMGIMLVLSIIFTKKIYRKNLTGFASLFLSLLLWLFYPSWFQWWGLLLFVAVIGILYLLIHRKNFRIEKSPAQPPNEDPQVWDILEAPPQKKKEGK